MTRRDLPHWERTDVPSARKLNTLSSEIGRLTGSFTGGNDLYVDNAAGRFFLASAARGLTLVPMIVTEMGYGQYGYGYGYDGGEAAISRSSHATYGFDAKKVDSDLLATGVTIVVQTDFLVGVLHTGDKFFAMRFNGTYYAVHTGNMLWTQAVSQEAFSASGRVELYSGGAIVTAETETPIADATMCDVEFDTQRQIYKIVRQRCPTEPEYGY